MEILLSNFLRLLEIHIQSKTTWTQFHKDTERAYELAFDCFHLLSEMLQDLWNEPTTDEDKSGQESYDLLESLQNTINDMIDNNKNKWFDNRLRTLSERLVDMCWTFRQYTDEEEPEEEKDDKEEEPEEETKSEMEQPTEEETKKLFFNLK